MTGFDVIAILVILASAAAGWVRGGTREIITLLSFVLAAFLALVALPVTAPMVPAQSGSTRPRPIGAVTGRATRAMKAASTKLSRVMISRVPPRTQPSGGPRRG